MVPRQQRQKSLLTLLSVVSRIDLLVNLGEGSLNSLRKPQVKGEAEPPQKGAHWAGRPGPFLRRLVSSFLPKSPGVFQSLCLSRLHPIRRRYLRDFFEEKDRMENPSLNISLLCLAPKYLDLILWALSFGLHWRVDVHERASNHHGLRSFIRALAFVFLCVIA